MGANVTFLPCPLTFLCWLSVCDFHTGILACMVDNVFFEKKWHYPPFLIRWLIFIFISLLAGFKSAVSFATRYVGEDWIFLLLLGITMALLSFFVDYSIERCLTGERHCPIALAWVELGWVDNTWYQHRCWKEWDKYVEGVNLVPSHFPSWSLNHHSLLACLFVCLFSSSTCVALQCPHWTGCPAVLVVGAVSCCARHVLRWLHAHCVATRNRWETRLESSIHSLSLSLSPSPRSLSLSLSLSLSSLSLSLSFSYFSLPVSTSVCLHLPSPLDAFLLSICAFLQVLAFPRWRQCCEVSVCQTTCPWEHSSQNQ